MSLVIAVDCDDVLVETLPQVVKDYNAEHGTQLRLEHMYRNLEEVADAFGVGTEQEAIQRLHKMYRQEGYYEALRPIEGAVDAIQRLAQKHELHVVTGRQSFLEAATKHTLDTYFPGIFTSVEHTNYYNDKNETTLVQRSKGEVCRVIRADILIDDHITHGEEVLAAGVKKVILFGEYPWNNGDSLSSGMIRCRDWQVVLNQIEKIDGAKQ